MELDNEKISEFLRFQIHRKIVNLYKNCLILLEDLKNPPYNLTDEDYKNARKKILDFGNNTLREIDEDFSKITINLK